jgi:hypothetical protein
MRRKLTWLVMCSVATIVAAVYTGSVWATSANTGFKASTIASGRFSDIEVFNKSITPSSNSSDGDQHNADVWLSLQKTRGSSDLYVQDNTWQPLGSTGWHTHPGHSLIIVTAGSVTEYESNDPDCKPHVYTAIPGMSVGFVDPGGDHVHIIRNESTTTVAKTIAIQLIPAGAVRRIDAAQPANCPNVQ